MAKKQSKPIWEMNTRELAAATKEFDQEFIAESFRQPTAKEREQLTRAKAKVGRPKIGEGSERVLVTIERKLLRDADALAKAKKTTRSRLVAEGLRIMLAKRRAG